MQHLLANLQNVLEVLSLPSWDLNRNLAVRCKGNVVWQLCVVRAMMLGWESTLTIPCLPCQQLCRDSIPIYPVIEVLMQVIHLQLLKMKSWQVFELGHAQDPSWGEEVCKGVRGGVECGGFGPKAVEERLSPLATLVCYSGFQSLPSRLSEAVVGLGCSGKLVADRPGQEPGSVTDPVSGATYQVVTQARQTGWGSSIAPSWGNQNSNGLY